MRQRIEKRDVKINVEINKNNARARASRDTQYDRIGFVIAVPVGGRKSRHYYAIN